MNIENLLGMCTCAHTHTHTNLFKVTKRLSGRSLDSNPFLQNSKFQGLEQVWYSFPYFLALSLWPIYLPFLVHSFFHLRPSQKDQPQLSQHIVLRIKWDHAYKMLGPEKQAYKRLFPSCFWIINLLSPWSSPPLSQLLHSFPALPLAWAQMAERPNDMGHHYRWLCVWGQVISSLSFLIANSFCKRKGPLVNIDAGRQGVRAVKQLKWGIVSLAARTWKASLKQRLNKEQSN